MLLFINVVPSYLVFDQIFQNISCYCLSDELREMVGYPVYFKTSHVIVYRRTDRLPVARRCISKHLMLLFIVMIEQWTVIHIDFKTSHVIVYRIWKRKRI